MQHIPLLMDVVPQVAIQKMKCILEGYQAKESDVRTMLGSTHRNADNETKKRRRTCTEKDESDVNARTSGSNALLSTRHCFLSLPRLSDDEMDSPLGLAIDKVMGILRTLEGQLMQQRKQEAEIPVIDRTGSSP